MKYPRLWIKHFALELSSEMAYKWNFIINIISLISLDFIGPLIALVIYTSTSGIPGWSLYEFLFFQGTLIFVLGVAHLMILGIPIAVVDMVRKGTLDKLLTRPYNVLLYVASSSIDLDGIAEMSVGLFLVIYTSIILNLHFSYLIFVYIFLVLVACLFQYALSIFISSLSFLFVKSHALLDLIGNLTDFARYPTTIFPGSIRFFITFLFPITISSFYPSEVLLHSLNLTNVISVVLAVIIFFLISLAAWTLGIRKYTSSGG